MTRRAVTLWRAVGGGMVAGAAAGVLSRYLPPLVADSIWIGCAVAIVIWLERSRREMRRRYQELMRHIEILKEMQLKCECGAVAEWLIRSEGDRIGAYCTACGEAVPGAVEPIVRLS